MNAPAPNAKQDKTTAILYGVVGSLIATVLAAAGAWLAGRQVPDETVLQFTYAENKVGRLSSWYVRVTNASEVAFDVQLTPPSSKLVRYEYHPQGDGSPGWKGQVPKGRTVEALFVQEDPSARLSSGVVQSLIAATYQERNIQTGGIDTRPGEVREAGVLPFARTALLIFWWLVPIGVASTLLLLPKGWKRWKERPRR